MSRILVVEDDAIVREAMEQLLSHWDCRCRAVASPDDAASLPKGEPAPDVLICDNRLREGLTGTDAIRTLKRHWGRPIPAIIITGDTAPARMREALESGVPVVHKPMSPDRRYPELLMLIPHGSPPR